MLRLCWLLVLLSLPGVARSQPHATSPPPPADAVRPPPAALRAQLLHPPALDREFAPPGPLAAPFPETPFPADTLQGGRREDPWLAFDKVQHLTFSFLWTLGSQYALVNKVRLSEGDALPVSIGVSASVGLAKEVYDWRTRRVFSRRDLAADALGILLATGLILL